MDVVIDNEPAKGAWPSGQTGLKILDGHQLRREDYAIGMNKSNTALLEAVNAALEELKADGTLQAIVDKYIKAGKQTSKRPTGHLPFLKIGYKILTRSQQTKRK